MVSLASLIQLKVKEFSRTWDSGRMSGMIRGIFAYVMLMNVVHAQLRNGFYSSTCPMAEQVIRQAVYAKYAKNPVAGPGTLRLFFHDCMVRGCDGSVLLTSTTENKAERDAEEGLTLPGDGFDTVIKAKAAVEEACPGVVSCADVLAIATRDLIALMGGPSYAVQTGRRDGTVSLASEVPSNVPTGNASLTTLTSIFEQKGLSTFDLVTLSGAHSVGVVHCNQFANRLYPQVDSAYDHQFAEGLKAACPPNVDDRIVINFDSTTPRTFDNGYFQSLAQHKGVLPSDQVLFDSPTTRQIVQWHAFSNIFFIRSFVDSITKLGNVGVKVGQEGEIRKFCDCVN